MLSYILSAWEGYATWTRRLTGSKAGLAQTEYGSVKGTVKSISDDAIVKDGHAVFKVIIEFDADSVTDSKGKETKLENGMTVTAWVTYEKVTYLKYFAEQLGLGKVFDKLFN